LAPYTPSSCLKYLAYRTLQACLFGRLAIEPQRKKNGLIAFGCRDGTPTLLQILEQTRMNQATSFVTKHLQAEKICAKVDGLEELESGTRQTEFSVFRFSDLLAPIILLNLSASHQYGHPSHSALESDLNCESAQDKIHTRQDQTHGRGVIKQLKNGKAPARHGLVYHRKR
jgi:hypothetical protein